MDARDETLLFSAIAILLATLTLGSLTEFASMDSAAQQRELLASRPVANRGKTQLSRGSTCVSTAAAGAAQSAADEQG